MGPIPVSKRRPAAGAVRQDAYRPTVIVALAGDERRRRFGEHISRRCTWLPCDSLELLPHLVQGAAAASVLVDLVRWTSVEAAPVLRDLRQRWPALRIVGLYEPSAEALPELARLARSDRLLGFASDADARLDLLLRAVPDSLTAVAPTVAQFLLENFISFAEDTGVRGTLIHLALAPSRRQGVPALATVQGWSEDALERHFAAAGLASPAMIRRLAMAAEGLWQVSALQRPADVVAQALGLETADGLGRMINGTFGFGFKAARAMRAAGARHALRWVGLLGVRELARLGGLPVIVGIRFRATDGGKLEQNHASDLVRALVNDGAPLGAFVDRLAAEPEAARRLVAEAVPCIRRLLQHRLIEPVAPLSEIL
jgi:hypothetical protein